MPNPLRLLAAALAVGAAAVGAMPKTIVLPPDGAQLRPSSLPGYAKAQANCIVCHSAEYLLYQTPAGRTGTRWRNG